MIRGLFWYWWERRPMGLRYWLDRARPMGYGHRHWRFRRRTCARCQEVRHQ